MILNNIFFWKVRDVEFISASGGNLDTQLSIEHDSTQMERTNSNAKL